MSREVPSTEDLGSNPRSETDGEDLDEKLEQDYRAIGELDQYASSDLDTAEFSEMSAGARRAAEQEIRVRRDRQAARRKSRMAGIMEAVIATDEFSDEKKARRRIESGEELSSDYGTSVASSEQGKPVDLDMFVGEMKRWLPEEATQKEIKRRFREFIKTFQVGGRNIYITQITTMCADNRESVVIDWNHLQRGVSSLVLWLTDEPAAMIELFDKELYRIAITMFPMYKNVTEEVHVRFSNLPVQDKIRDLRNMHLGTLVRVEGVVTRRSSVFPQLKKVKFNCAKCRAVLGPFFQNTQEELRPGRCPDCASKGPFSINLEETVYRNYQKVTLQEPPGKVPAGRVPRQKEVILTSDLIDRVTPGELVDLTGLYRHSYERSLNFRHGFPVFSTVVVANFIAKQHDDTSAATQSITEEDRREIKALSKTPEKVFQSIAPSIYGHHHIKKAVALALFGGQSKEFQNKHRLRGDINVLIVGDPGVGKSQFLKFVQHAAPRAVYTTGKGASAVGLTASVRMDPVTREWTLEGGALVLADRGVCLIDEFDKMTDRDRTSIHEAMEQQSISISKAGIVATLKARCAVIAAANPVEGRYDCSRSFKENLDMPDSLLSRFDLFCVVRDLVDSEHDAKLAAFVVDSHMRAHHRYVEGKSTTLLDQQPGNASEPPVSPELLRKYLLYARRECHPKLTDLIDQGKMTELYVDLREVSHKAKGAPITLRHMESIIRMSEAHARIRLSPTVSQGDVDFAIGMMIESFTTTQKLSIQNTLKAGFRKYSTSQRSNQQFLLSVLKEMFAEQIQLRAESGLPAQPGDTVTVKEDAFEDRAMDFNTDAKILLSKGNVLSRAGFRRATVSGTRVISFTLPAE